MEEEEQENHFSTPVAPKQSLGIPISIVFGFGLIAAAIFFSGGTQTGSVTEVFDNTKEPAEPTTGPTRPVDDTDHVRGNPNAPIVIVEYSDFDCPFCKEFHVTMNQVMDNYGTTGEVAWVYRHFPIEQIHPSAARVAEASECVAEQAGNDGFWKFADLVFAERNATEPTNLSRLNEFAIGAGADEATFVKCLNSGKYSEHVAADYADGLNAGTEGTPHSIISVAGQSGVINGAQPYSVVSKIIDNLLTQIRSNET